MLDFVAIMINFIDVPKIKDYLKLLHTMSSEFVI